MPHLIHRRGFTLIELLMVITVILILMGLAIGVGVSIREKARQSATSARMEHILSALANYVQVDGSVAMVLQQNFNLGGAPQFATVTAIDSVTTPAAAAQPPGFRYYWNKGGWLVEDVNFSNWQSLAVTSNGNEIQDLWTRMGGLVFDVMPSDPTASHLTSDWLTWWPTQWPDTNWNAGAGSTPPVLRFPWGRPGLRLDGSLCDPSSPPGIPAVNPPSITERQLSNGSTYVYDTYQLQNSWVTMGSSPPGGQFGVVWTNFSRTGQTDAVTVTAAVRSDGSSVPAASLGANLPLPFDLGYCTPEQTIALLQAAGVLAPGVQGGDDYRTNRSPSQPWNDAWGSPLVVVYAIFQPERYFRSFDQYDRRDLLLHAALSAYQFNRAIYVAVGSAGKQLYSGVPLTWGSGSGDTSQDAVTLQQYWLQIRDVCNAASWNEGSWQNPPWSGSKIGKKNGCTSMVTAPELIK